MTPAEERNKQSFLILKFAFSKTFFDFSLSLSFFCPTYCPPLRIGRQTVVNMRKDERAVCLNQFNNLMVQKCLSFLKSKEKISLYRSFMVYFRWYFTPVDSTGIAITAGILIPLMVFGVFANILTIFVILSSKKLKLVLK